ncbi:YegP family protein [Sinomonas terrae]|uniref:DUF1508 domain-containing protein n=1 Tax=Sinomonas terrae TaxID=2908838 RepID=A0ABS9U820_9MICC|nr:DUF1508 domain-containing protein [Sinomonas terrae]MCH6472420.1 DUF1508 domain-containing protein [Sinomonas terrae]
MAKRVLYTRNDGRWAWRLEGDDGRVIATDGGPGYASEPEARDMADRIIGGRFKEAIGDVGPERTGPGPAPGT